MLRSKMYAHVYKNRQNLLHGCKKVIVRKVNFAKCISLSLSFFVGSWDYMRIMSQNKRGSDLPICQNFQEVTTSRFHYWRCSLNNHIIFWLCDRNYIHGEMINNNFEKSIAFSNILVSISRGKNLAYRTIHGEWIREKILWEISGNLIIDIWLETIYWSNTRKLFSLPWISNDTNDSIMRGLYFKLRKIFQ